MHPIKEQLEPLQAIQGIPLKGDEEMLPGTWAISSKKA
jgi:hypothetical protein